MVTLYQEILMDHYRNPRFKGTIPDAHATSHEENPSCGDRIAMWVVFEGENLCNAAFEGEGCVISQACASLLLEHLIGQSAQRILAYCAQDIKNLIGISLGPVRLKCAMLPLIALQKTVLLYQQGLCDAQSR